MTEKINLTADLEAAKVEAETEPPPFLERRHTRFDASLVIDRCNRLEERNDAYAAENSRLRDLIYWLALKYADRNPEFPEYDPSTETVLTHNAELSATWYEVVRGGVRCEACRGAGHFKIVAPDPDINYLSTCEACEGLGFTKVSR